MLFPAHHRILVVEDDLDSMHMPGMNGLEMSTSLKRQPGLKDVRVIALTAYGAVEDRARCLAAGCEHHLAKPYDIKELLSLIAGK